MLLQTGFVEGRAFLKGLDDLGMAVIDHVFRNDPLTHQRLPQIPRHAVIGLLDCLGFLVGREIRICRFWHLVIVELLQLGLHGENFLVLLLQLTEFVAVNRLGSRHVGVCVHLGKRVVFRGIEERHGLAVLHFHFDRGKGRLQFLQRLFGQCILDHLRAVLTLLEIRVGLLCLCGNTGHLADPGCLFGRHGHGGSSLVDRLKRRAVLQVRCSSGSHSSVPRCRTP